MSGWWRRRRESELEEELASHFRLAVEDRMARGATRAEAESAARREFGSEVLVREATRRQWRGHWLERALADFGLAWRGFRRNPRYFAAALLCMAMGIGVTVTIFGAVYAVLVRPLPYADAEGLVVVQAQRARREARFAEVTPAELEAWRSARSFGAVATWRATERDVSGAEDLPERVVTASASLDLLPLLGARPAQGRLPAGTAAQHERSVVLSDALWRRRYGADPGVVGRTIVLDDQPHEVVAVLPPEFAFPEGTQLWTVLEDDPGVPPDILFYGGVVARLAPGQTVPQAQAEVQLLAERVRARDASYANSTYEVLGLREHLLGPLQRPVLVFQVAALLVLLAACANVAALQLARSAARQREFAVRSAIGAGQGELTRHVLIECLALALAGGVAGTLLAFAGTRLIVLAFPEGVPSYIRLSVGAPVLLAALGASLVSAVSFGVAPAVRARRARGVHALEAGLRSGAGSPAARRFRSALVTVEVAVSVVLAFAAVLLIRSDAEIRGDLGFEPAGLLSVRVPLPYRRYAEPGRRQAVSREIQERLRALPGVESMSWSFSAAPLDGPVAGFFRFRFQGDTEAPREQRAAVQHVGAGYARTLGLTLRSGRDLTPVDGTGGDLSALVNRTFVDRYVRDGDATGRVLLLDDAGGVSPPIRIVGVVDDVRHERPPAEVQPALYLREPTLAASHTFLLRTTLEDPLALAGAVRAAVHAVDPSLTASRLQSQEHLVRRAFWRERLQRNVVALFAVLALLLALLGMYGVVSYAVAQRTAEFGIRVAVGASARQLQVMVVREAAVLALAGVVIGGAAALGLAQLLGSMLHGVRAVDPVALGAVGGALLVTAMAAALLPARRAARLDPVAALTS